MTAVTVVFAADPAFDAPEDLRPPAFIVSSGETETEKRWHWYPDGGAEPQGNFRTQIEAVRGADAAGYSPLYDLPILDSEECREPCDPDTGCPHCAEYWQRMEHGGLWDREAHRWTDTGWREICKR